MSICGNKRIDRCERNLLMKEIKLLDCTLRDGGYVNDWNFGHDNLVCIFERLVDAGVDIIEIGFLDERRPFDINRSIMPDTDSVEKIYGDLDRGSAMIVGMIDYGTCSLEHIKPCSESYLDAIRVIFKKHLREEAMAFCAELKKLGYKVFAQLVSVTSYSDEEMEDLIRIANEVKPYAVSMVDTYGLMHQDNLKHYFDLLNSDLDPDIGIGYHAHNNFQMAYANCIELISQTGSSDRMLLVDGTIYGMGKSAGNAPLELLAMYLDHRFGKHYHVSQILEAIDSSIMSFYTPASWGYNMFFFLAASNDCHPNYVSDLMAKRTLSVRSVNELLGKLQGEKKLLYDRKYMEELYRQYQAIEVDDREDIAALKEQLSGKSILLLGPGTSIIRQRDDIRRVLEDVRPVVISCNFTSDDFASDYMFLSNSKRYVQMATKLSRPHTYRIIATSNVTKTSGKFDHTLKYSTLLDENAQIIDNSVLMLLKVMHIVGAGRLYLAGFDGYNGKAANNYINPNMEYDILNEQADELNRYVAGKIAEMKQSMEIEFVTRSYYEET